MSQSKKYNLSEETKQRMRAAHLGKKLSEEQKQKISEGHLGLKSPRLGAKMSEEQKQKISKSNKGKKRPPRSENYKQKMRKAHLGKKLSEETKQKMREAWSPINKRGRGIQGIYNGIHYDSSFELNFMKFLDEYNIPYERADNKKFRVKYIFENQEHYYYPDFYLPREGSIVEIKSLWQMSELKTKIKLGIAKKKYGKKFIIITEKELPELNIC